MAEIAPGFEEYTPSRLEWLVVMLNSYAYVTSMHIEDVNYTYTPGGDGKTITLHVRHFSDSSPEVVKEAENIGKDFAMDMARIHKWDSWLEIQTQFEPIDRETEKT